MANSNGGRINFQVGYNVDQNSINQVKKSLQDLQNIKFSSFKGTIDELNDVQAAARKVQAALDSAFNINLNSLNSKEFMGTINQQFGSIKGLYQELSKAGTQGQIAFNNVTRAALTTNLQLKQTKSLVNSMGETMANTVKWGIASSIMNSFTNSVQQAFNYVKGLDSALTDIRIVTGDSAEEMSRFADQANRAAQELGRSTMDYTKAALTFYQQGLSDQDVQARTEATLKAQNITGAGEQMADYLTAVWNGYKVANEEAELYVDKLAAVADSSASNMSQLAVAMSKVASVANSLGVPVDSLNAQIATIVATTRNAPESVGNALKTIYSRINDISTGAQDAQISLGNYSKKMLEVGVSVLDADGHLRDTGDVIEQIGGKWQSLSREQQIYLARTMAGQRQYNNLIALFDNWSRYTDLVNVSLDSQGSLMEKNSRYLDSLAAHMEQFGAAGQRVKAALIDEDTLKGIVDFGTDIVNTFASLVESLGGGGAALANFGAMFASIFSGVISKQINNVIVNIQNAKANADILKNDITATKTFAQSGIDSEGTKIVTQKMQVMQQYYSVMDKESINAQKNLIDELGQLQNQKGAVKSNIDALKQYADAWGIILTDSKWDENQQEILELANRIDELQNSAKNANQVLNHFIIDPSDFENLANYVRQFANAYDGINTNKADKLRDALNDLQNGNISNGDFVNLLNGYLNDAINKADQYNNTLKTGQQEQQRLNQQTKNLSAVIDQNNKKAGQLFNVNAAVKFATGISQVAMGINNIVNLTKIWKNQSISTGQKLLQTFTNLGFTITTFVNVLKSSQTILKALELLGQTQETRQKKITLEKTKQNALEYQIYLLKLKEQLLAKGEDVTNIDKTLDTVTKGIQNVNKESKDLISGDILGGIKQLGSSFIGFIASPAGVATVAIAALGTAIYLGYKAWNKQADAAKEAAKIASQTKKQYEEIKQAYDDLKSSLEDYNSAQKAIEDMTKGTQQWRDAIRESNDAVLQLLNNYPQLAQYISSVNGQLKISQQGQKAALEAASNAVNVTRLASIQAARDSRDASTLAQAASIGHQAWYGNAANAGQVTYASAQDVEAVSSAIGKVLADGIDFDQGKMTSAMADAIQKQTGLSLQQINAIVQGNEEQLIKLNATQQANLQATKLAYEAMAGQAFSNQDTYKLFNDIEKAIADRIGGQLLDQRTAQLQEQLVDSWKDSMNKWSGANNTAVQQMLAQFNKANNSNWVMDSNAVRGTNNNRIFAFIDESGDTHTLRAQQVAATIAAQQAIEQLDKDLAKTSTLISDLNDNYDDNQSNAIKNFIAGKDFGDLTQGQLTDLFQIDFTSLFEQHKEEFTALGYEDAETLSEAFSAEINSSLSVFENAGQTAFQSVNKAMDNVAKDGLKANTVKNIQKSFTDAFKYAGQKGLDSLQKVFKTINPEDLQKVSNIIANIDWSQDGAVYQLNKALEQQDIVLGKDVDGWEDFKNQLNNVSKSVGDANTVLNTLKETLSKISQYKDLKTGSIVKEQDYETLVKLNPQLERFFKISSQGMMYMGPEGGLSSALASSVDQIKSMFKGEGAAAQGLSNIDMASILGNFSFGDQDIIDTTAARAINGTQAFKNALTYLGVSEQALQEAVNTIQQYQNQEDLTSQQQQQLDEAKALIENTYNQMIGMQADFENEMYSDDVLSQLLATSSRTMVQLVDLFENGQVHAKDFAAALRQVSDTQMADLGFDVDQYQDVVKLLQATNQEYAENQYLARQIAKANMRISKGTQDLVDKWKDYNDAILDFRQTADPLTLAQDWGKLRDTLANTFNMDKQSIDMLGPDFVANNWDKIQQVKDGVEGAWEDFQQLASDQIQLNLKANLPPQEFAKIQDDINYIQDLANSADLEIGVALSGDEQIIDRFNNIASAAGWTSQQAQAAFAAMGYDVEVVGKEPEMHKDQQTTSYYVPPSYGVKKMKWDLGPFGSGDLIVPIETSPGHYETATGGYKESYEPGAYSIRTVTPNGKSFGGNISRNTAKASAPRSTGKSGGGGRKGGGGGKSSTPKLTTIEAKTTPQRTQKKEADYDPYQQNTKALERQEDLIDDLQNAEKKLLDKDRLKNIEQQNKALEDQAKILQDRLAISQNAAEKNTTAWFAKELQTAFGKNVGFDADGRIANRNQTEQAAVDAYNKAVEKADKEYQKALAKYNANAGKQLTDAQKKQLENELKAAEDKKKKAIDIAKEQYDRKTKLLDSYEKAWQEDEKTREQIEKIWDEIYENRIIESKIKVDLDIDSGDLERQWLEFENKVIKKIKKNDFVEQAKANAKQIASYFNSGQIESTKQQIDFIRKQIEIMESGGTSDTYGTDMAQAQKDLEQYMKQQMDDLEKIQDLVEEMQDNYLDAIDKARDKMDEQIDQYERVNKLIDHNVKLTQLLYGDKAYDTMDKYYEKQKQNNQEALQSLRAQQQYWQQRMDNETPGSEAWQKFKKNVDDATDNLNDKLEQMIQNLSNQWQNRVDGIIDKLNNALTGGRGLDYLDEQWDYINDYDDKFLDTVESKMGIQDVQSLYNSAIESVAGNPKAQQRINKLMNDQLKILKEKDKLTQYDLDRAKAMLQVEQARMDLEDARNNKTKMRLRRDSQGNYTYQYVADEGKLEDLQSALADAQSNLYNMDKEHYKQNLNDMYDTYKDYLDNMRNLTAEYRATQDEEERRRIKARMDLLRESYSKLSEGLTQDNEYALRYLTESYFDAMGQNPADFSQEEQFNILKENVPQVASDIQTLTDNIVGAGGLLPATADAIKEITDAIEVYDEEVTGILETAGTSLDVITQVVNAEGDYLDNNIAKAKELVTANEQLISSIDDEITKVQELLNYVQQYLQGIMDIEEVLANLRDGYDEQQRLLDHEVTVAQEIAPTANELDTTLGRNVSTPEGRTASDVAAQLDYISMLNSNTQEQIKEGVIEGITEAGQLIDSVNIGEIQSATLYDEYEISQHIQQLKDTYESQINSLYNQIADLESRLTSYPGMVTNVQQLDQDVQITANFPNVNSSAEIEQAFYDLVNAAAQYSSKYKQGNSING